MPGISLIMNGAARYGGGGYSSGGGLMATLSPGALATRALASFDFGVNTCTVVGGTGPYNFIWTVIILGVAGTWPTTSGVGVDTLDILVSGMGGGGTTKALYTCTVIDDVGNFSTSGTVLYTYTSTL